MSREKKRVVGKVGWCSAQTLRMDEGHYVYIRTLKDGKCDVNIITSLEDENGKFAFDKLHKVRKGYLYPIPKYDANFSRWSAINLDGNKKNIPLAKIIGIGNKKFKRRHRFFVGKFTKK